MAIQAPRKLFNFLGLVSWGDLAGTTIYRSKRGKLVWLSKTWPKKPPSFEQSAQRALFTAAAIAWHALTEQKRHQWHLAARRASLAMHGYTLFVHFQLKPDPPALATIARQTRTSIP